MVFGDTFSMVSYSRRGSGVQVHLSQTGFMSHLIEENNIHHRNIAPNATPYRSGLPIDACPESDEDEDNPTFLKRRSKY